MRVSFTPDASGRMVCVVEHETGASRLIASDPITAGVELIAALEDARDGGFGECFWHEPHGDYRWMFRLSGQRLAIAALWSSGTITGWEHIFQTETGFDAFDRQVKAAVAAFGSG